MKAEWDITELSGYATWTFIALAVMFPWLSRYINANGMYLIILHSARCSLHMLKICHRLVKLQQPVWAHRWMSVVLNCSLVVTFSRYAESQSAALYCWSGNARLMQAELHRCCNGLTFPNDSEGHGCKCRITSYYEQTGLVVIPVNQTHATCLLCCVATGNDECISPRSSAVSG